MRAIVIGQFGGLEGITLQEVETVPPPAPTVSGCGCGPRE
jgi:hypothetical protein